MQNPQLGPDGLVGRFLGSELIGVGRPTPRRQQRRSGAVELVDAKLVHIPPEGFGAVFELIIPVSLGTPGVDRVYKRRQGHNNGDDG